MAQLFVEIGAKISGFQRQLTKIERRVNRFSRNMERLGTNLTQSITLPLAALGAGAVSTFAQFDKLEKGLGAIAGSADEGKRQLNDLLEVVKDVRTTIDLKAAATGSLQLQAVGISADRVKESLRQLAIAATVSGGSSDDVAEVARQLAQAAAKGNILQQELRIILERIPALAGVIKNEFGTVTAEGLRDAGVSADEFISRLTKAIAENEKFANVQASLSKEIETFKINLQLSANELGRSIANAINLSENLRRLSDFISRVTEGFKSLTPETQSFIVKAALVVAAIGPVLLILGKLSSLIPVLLIGVRNLAGVFGLLSKAVAFLLSPVGLTVAAVVGLGAAIVIAYNRSTVFRRGINAIINVILELGKIVGDVVTNILQGFEAIGQGDFKGALTNFSEALTNINPIAGLAEGQGGRLGRAFLEGWEDESNRITDGIDTLKNKIFRATSGILPGIQDAGGNLAGSVALPDAAGSTGGGLTEEQQQIRREVDALTDSLQNVANTNQLALKDLIPETLEPSTRKVAENVGLIGRSLESLGAVADIVLGEGKGKIAEKMERLKDITQEWAEVVTGVLSEGFTDFFNTLIEGGTNAFQGFISAIKKLVVQLATAVATAAALALLFTIISGGTAEGLTKIKNLLGFSNGSLFKNFLNIPGFAEGGIVPPGYPNDSYFARLSSGEAVIPLNKLNQYGGGAVSVTGEFRLQGNDLVAAVVRNQQNRERTRGR